MTPEILERCDERRALKATKNIDEDCAMKYGNANKAVRQEIKQARENFLMNRCEDIERGFENNNSKITYEVVKELTRERSAKVSVIEDAQDNLLKET